MAVVDKLITEFVSDTSRFNLRGAVDSVEHLGSSILRTSALLAGTGVAALVAFTSASIKEAAKIESLTATFSALAGSIDLGRAKIKYLEDFALSSLASFDAITPAATLLEAGGVRMERLIPTIANMAVAFGNTKESYLELAGALARVPGGKFGETLEVLRRFGISSKDLELKGIKFTKGGEAIATANEFFTAFEKVAEERFGNISKFMADSIGVKFSNLEDSWHHLMNAFGQAWFPVIKEIVDSVTPFVDFLTKSGEVEKISKSFAAAFSGLGDSIPDVLAYAVALVEKLPEGLTLFWNYFKGVFTAVGSIARDVINIIVRGFIHASTLLKQMEPQIKALAAITKPLADVINKILEIRERGQSGGPVIRNGIPGFDFAGGAAAGGAGGDEPQTALDKTWEGVEKYFAGLPKIGPFFEGVTQRADEIFKQYQTFLGRNQGGMPDPHSFPFLNRDSDEKTQDDIEKNTRKTAESMSSFASDLRRYVVGGGPVAQVGVTPAELGAFQAGRGGGGSGITVNLPGSSPKLKAAVQEIAESVHMEIMRQKPWGHTRIVRQER